MSSSIKTLRIPRPRSLGVFASVLLATAILAVFTLAAGGLLGLEPMFAARVIGLFAIAGALLIGLAGRHLPSQRFGPANQVTLARLALVAMLAGLLWEPTADAAHAWAAAAIAALTLALDGIDGHLARRFGDATAFGARFDMEIDALLMLVLAALVWRSGQAGAWVVAVGLMRYGFVAAAAVIPRLRQPLPVSRRRQAAFVAATLALIACLLPLTAAGADTLLALGALIILGVSFAIDLAWLVSGAQAADGSAP